MAAAAAAAKAEAESRVQAEVAARASAEHAPAGQDNAAAQADSEAALRAAEAARQEALTKAEETARALAEAEARMKAEAEARAEAEAKARAETELREQEQVDKLQKAAELQIARDEAEAKTRAEFKVLEENIRKSREEVHAREESERKLRAEFEARLAEERKAREASEARAAAEIAVERKAREEAERKREEAEKQASNALQISATAEKLIREEASKETAIAEKSREEAQRMRDEAQRALEAERLQHEQAVAKAQSEMQARLRAEQKALAEKQARAAAEDRAKQEAIARVMQERQSKQDSEKEVQAKVEAEMRLRAQAELDADVKSRTEAQQRADEAAQKRALQMEEEEAAAQQAGAAKPRKPMKWGHMAGIGLIVLIVLGVGALQILPLRPYIPSVEKLLSERLQEPVNIGSMHFSLFPPQLKLDHISIGNAQDVRIDAVTFAVASTAILDERKNIDELDVSGFVIEQDALPRLVTWAQAPAGSSRLQIQRLKLSGIKVLLRGAELPSLYATVTLGKDGGWQKLSVRDGKANVELVPLDKPGQVSMNFSARNWQSPVGPNFEYADLTVAATMSREQATFTNIEGHVLGGALKGTATMQWKSGLAADGEFSLKGADVGAVLAAYTRDFVATGTLDTSMKFATQGQTVAELFAAPRVNATFTLQKGTLSNVDLVRAIQSASRGGNRGGKTQFTEIAGEAQSTGNRIAYRNLKLVAGPLNATGSIDVSPAAELAGRLNVQLGNASVVIARGVLNVGGAVKDPSLSQ
jgi:hypothetical protein